MAGAIPKRTNSQDPFLKISPLSWKRKLYKELGKIIFQTRVMEPRESATYEGLIKDDIFNFGGESMHGHPPEADITMARDGDSMFYSFDAFNSNSHYLSGGSSRSSETTLFITTPSRANNNCISMDVGVMDEKNTGSFVPSHTDIVVEQNPCLNEEKSSEKLEISDDGPRTESIAIPAKQYQLKRKLDATEEKGNTCLSDDKNKKSRISGDIQKCKRNAQPKNKTGQKFSSNNNEEEETKSGSDGQSSSSRNSEDENASQETSGGATSASKLPVALNSNGKTRASRGSATDPQSLYARKRRERINERLRILQNLVPNGTKVDISTMLEEAVHYVKFLQLQIKLLSSDELWMYAPIAYNGIEIGGLNLNRNTSPIL